MVLFFDIMVVEEVGSMKIEEGYLYHISQDFFELVNDPNLQINHSGVHSRPSYFLVKDGKLLWFIPLSSKVSKYKKIMNEKKSKYGKCNTILITKIANKENAILIQNAFPTLPKFLSHPHTVNGKSYRVPSGIQKEIEFNFKELINLKSRGINLFFTNIDKIEDMMHKILDEENTR